jgi:hypothetical protein
MLEATFARLRGAPEPSRHPSDSSSGGQKLHWNKLAMFVEGVSTDSVAGNTTNEFRPPLRRQPFQRWARPTDGGTDFGDRR